MKNTIVIRTKRSIHNSKEYSDAIDSIYSVIVEDFSRNLIFDDNHVSFVFCVADSSNGEFALADREQNSTKPDRACAFTCVYAPRHQPVPKNIDRRVQQISAGNFYPDGN